MVEGTKAFIEEVKEFKKDMIKWMVDEGTFNTNMSQAETNLYLKMNHLLDTSMQLTLLQATELELIEKKLDKLLALKKN